VTAGPGVARASLHGVCRVCGIRDDLNNDRQGWCWRCWFELDAWAEPNLPPLRVTLLDERKRAAIRRERLAGGGWDPPKLPDLLYTPPRSRPTRATRRHWQHRPWQETPIGPGWPRASLHYDRHGRSRIDALNSDPLHSDAQRAPGTGGVHYDTGFVLRCLICLGPPEAYRPRHDEDQSCNACDQAWRRAGRPWFDAFDAFVEKRRRKYLRDNPAAQLFALTRLKSQTDQASHRKTWRVTRANDNDVVCNAYNGDVGGNESRRLALGLSVPYGWRRDDDDPGLLVPELTLETWQAAKQVRHLQSLPSCPPEPLATITDIAPRLSVASPS
jgi:hypothetical protein